MPFFDQTGPQGRGPMTGRGAGNCKGDGSRGMGRGMGRGRGFRAGYNPILTKNQTIENLKEYRKDLENELDLVNKEIIKLEDEK